MRFESPYFLLLLALIPFFYRTWYRRNLPAALQFSLSPTQDAKKKKFDFFGAANLSVLTRALALALLVVALARPQSIYDDAYREVSGIDIVVAMDVSASMNAEDLADRSRLQVAKDTIAKFIRGRRNDRIGFVVFSGEPLTLVPPTLDYGMLLSSVNGSEIGLLKDGTAIGDGLSVAINRLKDSESKSRVIILLTDGENNVGQVDPVTAGELAQGYQIRVYTIAIGREGRIRIPFQQRGPFGRVITRYQWHDNALNPELLKKIAALTDGRFYRATDASALQAVFQEIDQLEKTEIETNERVFYEERFFIFVAMALALLLLERLLSATAWRMFP